MSSDIGSILTLEGISPTPVRILVYKGLQSAGRPLSLSELEMMLETVDKSTISRTLSVFKDKHLLHCFNDGSGSMKYELCQSKDHDHIDDQHVHFYCEKCGSTICLQDIQVPNVILPEGYVAHEANFILAGICNNCNLKS